MKKVKRVAWVDIAKGLCIIQMVAFHTRIPFIGSPYLVNVTMPCFFMVSGWFFKEKFETLFRSFDKLIIPYIATSFFYNLLNFLIRGDAFSLPRSIWFLYVLYGVVVVYWATCKIFDNLIMRDVICFILLLLGYLMQSKYPYPYSASYILDGHYNFEPLKLGSICTMLAVFHVGHRLGDLLKDREIDIMRLRIVVIAVLGLSFVMALINNGEQFYNVAFNTYEKPLLYTLILWFVNILAIMTLSMLIKHSRVLEFFGKNSLVILCFHIFVLYFSIDYIPIIDTPLDFLLVIVLTPLAVNISNTLAPRLYGKKPSVGGIF